MVNLENIQYILTIDLELTCDDHPHFTKEDSEIIEIGWVLHDLQYKIKDKGSFFVKPAIKPVITPFCNNLTGISQKDIDPAFNLRTEVAQWVSRLPSLCKVMLACWGNDALWLKEELLSQDGRWLFHDEFINVKLVENQNNKRPKGQRGLGYVIKDLGIQAELPNHRALPDALTTVKVMAKENIGIMDYQVGKANTYRKVVTNTQNQIISKFVKRTNLDKESARKLLSYVDYDFLKALNIYKILKK